MLLNVARLLMSDASVFLMILLSIFDDLSQFFFLHEKILKEVFLLIIHCEKDP